METPREGQPAPDFELQTHQGRPLSLASFRGRNVVLFFFVKANTSG